MQAAKKAKAAKKSKAAKATEGQLAKQENAGGKLFKAFFGRSATLD